MHVIASWSTEEGILENVKWAGITQCFNIIDAIYHDPFKRIEKRNFFFEVLKKNELVFPHAFLIYDKRFDNWTEVKKLWN